MPDYVDGFVTGALAGASFVAAAVLIALFWRDIWRGFADFVQALEQLFNPTFVVPQWLRHLLERIRR
jgi:hypothetical protein